MRVFVAGGTGVVGRRAVAQLVAAGHDVTGLARTPEKEMLLRSLGARPLRASLFDPDELRGAVAGHDAVVNLATRIPPAAKALRASAWAENDRIRTEGARNLADAAIAAGAEVYVQESIAFLYGDHGTDWIDEDVPLVDSPFSAAVRAAEGAAARVAAAGARGVVLRFGMFWAAASEHTTMFLAAARRGFVLDAVVPGGYLPMIDADDAASAVVAALDAPSGVYNVVDDPLPRRDVARALASAVGRRRLTRLPVRAAFRHVAPHLTWSQRVSNRRFRETTGWRADSPTAREIVGKAAAEVGGARALGGMTRALVWLLALTGLIVGSQAAFLPRSFYDDFPLGRGWVAIDGAYNEHLVRDVGALNLALAAVAFAALLLSTRAIARVAAVAWFVYSVPHFVYHLRHLEGYKGADLAGNIGGLAITAVVPVLVWWSTRGRTPAVGAASPAPSTGESARLPAIR